MTGSAGASWQCGTRLHLGPWPDGTAVRSNGTPQPSPPVPCCQQGWWHGHTGAWRAVQGRAAAEGLQLGLAAQARAHVEASPPKSGLLVGWSTASVAMEGGQKEGKHLPVVTQEVCGEETSPIFPSPDDAGMDNASPASHRDAWRCQERKQTRLGPDSPPRSGQCRRRQLPPPAFPPPVLAVGRGLPHCTPRNPPSPIPSHGAPRPQRIIWG